jgi:hypothetical protein
MANIKENQPGIMEELLALYEKANTALGPAHAVTAGLRLLAMRHSTPAQRQKAIAIYRKLNTPQDAEAVEAASFPKRRRFGADPRTQQSVQPNRAIPDGGPFKRRNQPEKNNLKTGQSGLPVLPEPPENAPVAGDEITTAPNVKTTVKMVAPLSAEELASITGLKPAGIAARFDPERLGATIFEMGGTINSEWTSGAQYAAALLRLIKAKASDKSTGFSGNTKGQ